MSHNQTPHQLPAPCIIDSGIIVNKDDMRRLLNDLGRVHYVHILDNKVKSEGEGWVLEVFAHPHQATLVVNQTLYLNVESFDYLEIAQSQDQKTQLDLIQDNRQLRLIPANASLEPEVGNDLDVSTLEAMVTEVLSAKWDVQLDDEYPL